jgi:preprotein translocase subunit SecY
MFTSILNTLSNCFKMSKLKSRILFTVIALGICRLAVLVPAPGLDSGVVKAYFAHASDLTGAYSMFTAGGFEKYSVTTAQRIMPCLCAVIVLQLLLAVAAAARQSAGPK